MYVLYVYLQEEGGCMGDALACVRARGMRVCVGGPGGASPQTEEVCACVRVVCVCVCAGRVWQCFWWCCASYAGAWGPGEPLEGGVRVCVTVGRVRVPLRAAAGDVAPPFAQGRGCGLGVSLCEEALARGLPARSLA